MTKQNRRDFLTNSIKAVGAFGIVYSKPLATFHESYKKLTVYEGVIPTLQGMTNADTTQITFLLDTKKSYSYLVLTAEGSSLPFDLIRREAPTYATTAIEKILVKNLALDQTYTLQIIDNQTGKAVDERFFKTIDLSRPSARIGFASCMDDKYKDDNKLMWYALAEQKPEFVFLNGDTCYADSHNSGGAKGYWTRYAETRSNLSFFRAKDLVPTVAVWDDHDFGGNNYDGSFRDKAITLDLFEVFWGNAPMEGYRTGPGVSKIMDLFGQRYCMMDGRYFRDQGTDAAATMWGKDQYNFLMNTLQESNKPTLLMTGSQFFGKYTKKDGYEYSIGNEFKVLLSDLAKIESPIAFGSGDVHYSEIQKIAADILGYETFEFTSSSIHSSAPFFGARSNPRRVAVTKGHNFMMLETQMVDGKWNIHAQTYSKSAKSIDQNYIITR